MNTLAHINTLHELLALALEDFDNAATDPAVKIDMGEWHFPSRDGRCVICIAGAVMRETLRVADYINMVPNDFEPSTNLKLFAIDALRRGRVLAASHYCRTAVQGYDREVATFDRNPTQWRADMDRLLADLREANV